MNENENEVTATSTVVTPEAQTTETETNQPEDGQITRLRNEAATERTKRKEAEKELGDLRKFKEERERADLESEKKYKELADKEREARESDKREFQEQLTKRDQRIILGELKHEALKAGMVPEAIADLKLLTNLSELSLDENDDVVGLSDFVTALKESKPYLFKSAEDDKPKRERPSPPPGPKTDKVENDISKMSEDEWQRYKATKLNRFQRF